MNNDWIKPEKPTVETLTAGLALQVESDERGLFIKFADRYFRPRNSEMCRDRDDLATTQSTVVEKDATVDVELVHYEWLAAGGAGLRITRILNMSDDAVIETPDFHLSYRQLTWLRDASRSQEEIQAFIAGATHGYACELYAPDSEKVSYAAMLRGCRVGGVFETCDLAKAHAEEILVEYKAESCLTLDESALGIEDTPLGMQRLRQEEIRLDKISPIAASGLYCSSQTDNFRELFDDYVYAETTDVFVEPELNAMIDEFKQDGDLELLFERMLDHRIDGVFALVESPSKNYSPDGRSASYSWGCYHQDLVYGHTMDELVERAIEIAHGHDAKAKAKAMAKAKEPAPAA